VGDEIIIPNGEITSTPVAPGKTGGKPSGSYSGPSYPGFYIKPVAGILTQGLHGHNGVDLGAHTGTPIWAAADGVVIVARSGGWNGGYGSYVVIAHNNGTQTLYGHMSSVAALVGETVSQGDVIGYVGSTGESTGPHLHFEVRGAANPFAH
jgi:murein DD-endopeptidase MepM/ murein hydrolase activator NlpD